ncbi:spermatogenesis-associated protein 31D1-like [Arvicola amphibius]|uniref:spermatogenesis-associated protein 31D1-like n=1 Tax=Arvicola amphibius TaxID=1047088 RepID=UPI0018E2F03A|nr:spermatogenesis-associated protein 31D1-like [Arvicola amphibius]
MSLSASWPPETLTPGRHHSPPRQASSYPSHPLDPVASPAPMPDPSMAAPEFEWKILSTSQRTPLQGWSSPMPTTPGFNLSRRPTSTILSLNYSSRSTSTNLDLDHLSRPISTTSGLDNLSRPTSTNRGLDQLNRPKSTTSGFDHLSRPTSTSPGLDHFSRSISGPFRYQVATKTLYHSNLTCDESLPEDLSLTIHEALFRTGHTDWQIEAGEPSFINRDMQDNLDVRIRKRVQLNGWKQKEKGRSDLCWLHSRNNKQDIISCLFWRKNCESEQFSAHQKVLGNDLKETYNQLFWGHPVLHSKSLVTTVSMTGPPLHRPSILFNGSST